MRNEKIRKNDNNVGRFKTFRFFLNGLIIQGTLRIDTKINFITIPSLKCKLFKFIDFNQLEHGICKSVRKEMLEYFYDEENQSII